MKKLFIPLTIISVVIIVAAGIFLYVQYGNLNNSPAQKIPVIISQTDDQFTLKADQQDSLGTDPQTTFTLASKSSISSKAIQDNLVIEPAFNYKIESSDNNTFTIIPKNALQPNTVYSFSLTTTLNEQEGAKRSYTWAYQIKDTFKITGTLPRDLATNVPANSGIEITFSSENFTEPEKYFDITPKVEGKFDRYLKTLIFAPNNLSNSTVYTVTIKKGLPLQNSDETLADDYVFKFETEPDNISGGYLTFGENFYEYPAAEKPVLTASEYNTDQSKIPVSVWKYPSFSEFSTAVKTRTQSLPYWAYYANQNNPLPTTDLQQVLTFEAQLQDNQFYAKYFEFPETLAEGDYLVEMSWGEKRVQSFLQISNLAAAFQGSKTSSFIWLNDLTTKKPVGQAIIKFSEEDSFKEKTDDHGLAVFDTPTQLQQGDEFDMQNYQIYFFTATSGDENILIPTNRNYSGWGYDFSGPTTSQNDYWSYLYTNRSLYQPTDTLKFWGVAKPRQGSLPDQVTVELTSTNYYNPNFDRQKQLVGATKSNISTFGTYTGEIKFSNLAPGSYRVAVYVGDTEITSNYINIQTYTKAPYAIDIKASKKAIFSGETVTFDITTKFFDGTPVGSLALNYSGSLGQGSVTTDANGQASVALATSYQEQSYYPSYQYFTVNPASAEITNIYGDAYVYVFGPRYQLDLSAEQSGQIKGTISEINLDKLNADGQDFTWDYSGPPLPGLAVSLKIYHEYYDKIENGSYYDYINKKTVKIYNYEQRENLLKEDTLTSDANGQFSYDYDFETGKNYKIIATTNGSANHPVSQTAYIYGGQMGYYYGWGDNYYLSSSKTLEGTQPESYLPGQTVSLTFMRNEEVLPQSEYEQYVYYKDHNGIFDVTASTDPKLEFEFRESYSPNVFVNGIYFNGRSYKVTYSSNIAMNKDYKKLNISVKPDQDAYEPGAKARLDLAVTDPDNNPVSAEVNVSIIDEALAAIQWDNQSTILNSLYSYIQPAVTYSYVTDKEVSAPMAERGGCFSGTTPILMTDGSQKNIEAVKPGDQILTKKSEQNPGLASTTVLAVKKHLVNEYLTINNVLEVTPVHKVFVNDVWQEISKAKPGDYLRDAQGQKVTISSIISHHQPLIVYNLQTTLHTFFADNIYVHNEKGGNRQNFQDVAFFNSMSTDKKGQARVEFTLPDNITSWRTTVQALTKDMMASGVQTALITTKPFFVDVAMSDVYLTIDKPIIKLRGFGSGLSGQETVNYEVTYPDLNKTEKYSGQAFASVDVSLPEFTAGTHNIVIKGSSSDSKTDSIVKKVTFKQTNLTTYVTAFDTLGTDTKINGNPDGSTLVTFMNKERGQYYDALNQLLWQAGDRVDQKMAYSYSQKILNEFFNEQHEVSAFPSGDYQLPEGGISLLPYSSADLLLSAKVMELGHDIFDTVAAKNYFNSFLESKNSTHDEIVYALFGLANIGQPVLTDIINYLNNQSPTLQQQVYLARGLGNLGAGEYAKTIISEIISQKGEKVDPYIRLVLGDDQDSITEFSYQAAIIAGQTSMPEGEQLFNYAHHNPATHNLNTLEELSYLTKAVPLLSETPVAFDYTLDNDQKTVALVNNETYSLVLDKDQVANMVFANITGSIGLAISYETPIDLAHEQQDGNVQIKRSYSVNGKRTTTFSENDLVKITLEPTVASKAIDTEYQITDYLPAGLKILTETYTRNIGYDQTMRFPYEINGQAVKFWTGKPATSFTYYAMVIGKGTYKADSATIQGFTVRSSKSYSTEAAITIK